MFSAGYDIGGLPKDAFAHQAESLVAHPFHDAIAALEAFPYPAVAALNGHAIGGGLELALTCDLRMAATGAKLGMPPAKLGLVYSHTGLRKFIDAIGVTRTRDLFFTGRNVSAATALEWGMVTEIAPAEKLAERALALRDGDRRQRAALAGRQQARDHRAAGRRGPARPRGRGGARRAARGVLPQRGLLRRCARVRGEAGSRMAGAVRGAIVLARSRSRPRCRPLRTRRACSSTACSSRRVVRLRDLGPGAQADAEPRLAALGHAQADRHHRARAARLPRRAPRRARACSSATSRAATAASSAGATAGSATRRTRTGSTSTSTTPASTASSERRGAQIRSTAWPPRSSSTASSPSARSRSSSGPHVRLSGRRGVVTPLVYHDDHLHVRLSASPRESPRRGVGELPYPREESSDVAYRWCRTRCCSDGAGRRVPRRSAGPRATEDTDRRRHRRLRRDASIHWRRRPRSTSCAPAATPSTRRSPPPACSAWSSRSRAASAAAASWSSTTPSTAGSTPSTRARRRRAA